jgi:hypothetical protein
MPGRAVVGDNVTFSGVNCTGVANPTTRQMKRQFSVCCSDEITPALEQSNRSYGDTPTEADIDVCTTGALAGMIEPVVE